MSRTVFRFHGSTKDLKEFYQNTFRKCVDCNDLTPLINMAKFGIVHVEGGIAVNRPLLDYPEGRPWPDIRVIEVGKRCNKCEAIFDHETKLKKLRCSSFVLVGQDQYQCNNRPDHDEPHQNEVALNGRGLTWGIE